MLRHRHSLIVSSAHIRDMEDMRNWVKGILMAAEGVCFAAVMFAFALAWSVTP